MRAIKELRVNKKIIYLSSSEELDQTFVLVSFPVTDKSHLVDEGLYFRSQLQVIVHHPGKSLLKELRETAYTTTTVRESNRCILVFSWLLSSYQSRAQPTKWCHTHSGASTSMNKMKKSPHRHAPKPT